MTVYEEFTARKKKRREDWVREQEEEKQEKREAGKWEHKAKILIVLK